MTNPLIHAFFVGRATAEVLIDRFEDVVTDLLSALGKFDAEQREIVREFTAEVMEKATQQAQTASVSSVAPLEEDLQETLDNLRAEIAQLKAELQQYRERNVI